jgi:diketogulonate reductase-like aldo/keto reductase
VYDNEAAVGEGIAAAPVPREDVFLTTKLWRSNLRREDVREATRASLDRLGVDRVDLLLIHWPHPRVPVAETLDAMVALRDEGLVSHLGVANFTREQYREARRVADAPLVTDQVLYHPYLDRAGLRADCAAEELSLTAYSPLARGDAVGDPVLADVGAPHGKSAAQVALRWLLQQDRVVAIPKATGRAHLVENRDVFDFELTESEMDRVTERRGSLVRRLKDLAPAVMRRVPF